MGRWTRLLGPLMFMLLILSLFNVLAMYDWGLKYAGLDDGVLTVLTKTADKLMGASIGR